MHPIDKRIIFLKNFVFMTPRKGMQKDVTSPPQWDNFLYVLGTSDLRPISLDVVENPNKKWNSKGVHNKKDRKI